MAYATADELDSLLDGDAMPEHPDRLLARASEIVDEVLTGVVYTTNGSGQATDQYVIDTLKQATLLQAQFMADTDDETGAKTGFASMATGGVSWSRQGTSRDKARYAPAMLTYLRTRALSTRVYPGRYT